MIKRIYVNQHRIKANKKGQSAAPPISVATYKGVRTGRYVFINGPSHVVYQPNKPLHCGASCWIETHAPVAVVD